MIIEEISEQYSCVMGGTKVLVRLCEESEKVDLVPVFKVYVGGSARPELEKFIIQPNLERGSTTWLIFYTPSQPYISNLPEDARIKLTVMERVTGLMSSSMFDFHYTGHRVGRGPYNGGRCVHCSGLLE